MSFDLQSSLRALKPQKRVEPLRRRDDSELNWAADEIPIGSALFLDTSVYIDVLQGRSPQAVDQLLAYRTCLHSAVCLAELTHVFGRLNPAHPDTASVLETIAETIGDIPEHRLYAPDVSIWGQAGILAGELVRLCGMPKGDGSARRFLNDALVYLQARALGASVLTGNIRDFDYLSQLVPGIGIVLYRASAR